MNSTLKTVLITIGIIAFLSGVGGLGYHLLKTSEPIEVISQNTAPVVSEEQMEIMVSIAGAVNNPGVYTLKTGDRLYQVIGLAGGFTEEAATENVNLALRLKDEDHHYIPKKGDLIDGPFSTSVKTSGRKININTADQVTLETLPGIGPSLASRIIEYRQTNGSFASIEEIKEVSGIGDKRFEAIKDLITVR